jgi:hypothetical protein
MLLYNILGDKQAEACATAAAESRLQLISKNEPSYP